MVSDPQIRSETIKKKATELGFDDCGIASAAYLTDESRGLLNWLEQGYHADMSYMERNIDKRSDPRLLEEGTQSLIVVTMNYFPPKTSFRSDFKIAKYAYGKDYHIILKDKLYALLQYIRENISPAKGRCFTDSAPVMERSWAVKAGLGWIGKNGNLLTRKHGSFVFIGEILLDVELAYDQPNLREYCGSCNICIDQCPTGAIVAPKVIDSRKCISYQTIENKNEIPDELDSLFQQWIFGCDICQDVCPWNRKSIPTSEPLFSPPGEMISMTNEAWSALTEKKFNELFKTSPLSRTGHSRLLRNISHVKKEL